MKRNSTKNPRPVQGIETGTDRLSYSNSRQCSRSPFHYLHKKCERAPLAILSVSFAFFILPHFFPNCKSCNDFFMYQPKICNLSPFDSCKHRQKMQNKGVFFCFWGFFCQFSKKVLKNAQLSFIMKKINRNKIFKEDLI